MARAVSPVVGVTLLIGITVVVGAMLGAGVLGMVDGAEPPDGPVVISLTASSADGRLVLRHESGPPIDVRRVTIHISIDGDALAHQPPIPFFAATGFRGGPTGPFNPATDPEWELGERASLRIAGTNRPVLVAGSTVVVRIDRDDRPLARAEAVAT